MIAQLLSAVVRLEIDTVAQSARALFALIRITEFMESWYKSKFRLIIDLVISHHSRLLRCRIPTGCWLGCSPSVPEGVAGVDKESLWHGETTAAVLSKMLGFGNRNVSRVSLISWIIFVMGGTKLVWSWKLMKYIDHRRRTFSSATATFSTSLRHILCMRFYYQRTFTATPQLLQYLPAIWIISATQLSGHTSVDIVSFFSPYWFDC